MIHDQTAAAFKTCMKETVLAENNPCQLASGTYVYHIAMIDGVVPEPGVVYVYYRDSANIPYLIYIGEMKNGPSNMNLKIDGKFYASNL